MLFKFAKRAVSKNEKFLRSSASNSLGSGFAEFATGALTCVASRRLAMRELSTAYQRHSLSKTALPNGALVKTKNRHLRLDTCIQMRLGMDASATSGLARPRCPHPIGG
jgi:hypothetical protein